MTKKSFTPSGSRGFHRRRAEVGRKRPGNRRLNVETLESRQMMSVLGPPSGHVGLDVAAPGTAAPTALLATQAKSASYGLIVSHNAMSFPAQQTVLHFRSTTTDTMRNVTIAISLNGKPFTTVRIAELAPWDHVYLTNVPLGTYTFTASATNRNTGDFMYAADAMTLKEGNKHGNAGLVWRKTTWYWL